MGTESGIRLDFYTHKIVAKLTAEQIDYSSHFR